MRNTMLYGIVTRIIGLEKRLFSDTLLYIQSHANEVFIFICLYIAINVVDRIPYLNIIMERYFAYFLLISASKYIFGIPTKVVGAITLGLFIPLTVMTLLGNQSAAEDIGNLIYLMLLFTVFIYFGELRKQK